MPFLDGWSVVVIDEKTCQYKLVGIVSGHNSLPDDRLVTTTVVSQFNSKEKSVTTMSGTKYLLGKPAEACDTDFWEKWQNSKEEK